MPTPPVRAELAFPIILSLSKEASVELAQPFDKLRANGGSPIILSLSKDKLRANGYLFAMCAS